MEDYGQPTQPPPCQWSANPRFRRLGMQRRLESAAAAAATTGGPSETRELITQEKHYDYDDDPRRLLLTVDFSPLARVFSVVHLQRQKWPLTALLNWSSTSNSGPHFILLFLLFYNHATNFDAIEK